MNLRLLLAQMLLHLRTSIDIWEHQTVLHSSEQSDTYCHSPSISFSPNGLVKAFWYSDYIAQ